LPLNPFIHHTPSQTPCLKQSPKHNQLPIPLTQLSQKAPEPPIQLPNQLFHLIHQPQNFNHLYHLKQPLQPKIQTILKQIYGAT
ncbi:formate--tetrahydrofolate ligase, partial [Staphylococcus epidermidis]|uniref:formate--tetrahydrofolate ligase n=1 Tax=Staphylococcus epidermidis TaxID=1282 RepID=UPI00119D4F57